MILVRYHKKAPEFAQHLRKFVIYWVELMEEQTNGGQMTVIMSCVGAGLSNLVSIQSFPSDIKKCLFLTKLRNLEISSEHLDQYTTRP